MPYNCVTTYTVLILNAVYIFVRNAWTLFCPNWLERETYTVCTHRHDVHTHNTHTVIHTHMYAHTPVHTHMQTHTDANTRTHTHTHVNMLSLKMWMMKIFK